MDARTVELGLPEACRALGLLEPGIVWEDDFHPDVAENGDPAPGWVNRGEWAIHLHQDPMAYVKDLGDLVIPGHLERAVRHTTWHELGHLFSDVLWQTGGPNVGLHREIERLAPSHGISRGEILAEAVAQYLIITTLEPRTLRYLALYREDRLLVALGEDIDRMRRKALDKGPLSSVGLLA